MSALKNLSQILGTLSPQLCSGSFVFCTLPNGDSVDITDLNPFATVREPEGLTLVLLSSSADDAQLHYDGRFTCISLLVHSSLESVGLTAVVSSELAKNGISANVVAGFYHDHIFVPENRAHEALDLLMALSEYAANKT